jgi:hypothetical protein
VSCCTAELKRQGGPPEPACFAARERTASRQRRGQNLNPQGSSEICSFPFKGIAYREAYKWDRSVSKTYFSLCCAESFFQDGAYRETRVALLSSVASVTLLDPCQAALPIARALSEPSEARLARHLSYFCLLLVGGDGLVPRPCVEASMSHASIDLCF